MVKIFFGCSMRGGFHQVSQDDLRKLGDAMEAMGYSLVSRHQTSPSFTKDEAPLANTQIHDRDYEWLMAAEVGIFEISNPSLGVGGEISDCAHLGKPVLCLYKSGLAQAVSAYTMGKEGSQYVKAPFHCRAYGSLAEAEQIIKTFVETHTSRRKPKQ